MIKQTFLFMLAALVLMPAIGRPQEDTPEQDYVTIEEARAEVRKTIEQFKQRVNESESGQFIVKLGPRKKDLVIGQAFLSISKKIVDPDYPADKCRDEFILFVRTCYTQIPPTQTYLPFYYKGISILAEFLYVMKGRIAGMYEVTKLSGYGMGTLYGVNNPRWAKDPKLLKYQLWCIKRRFFDPPKYVNSWRTGHLKPVIDRLADLQSRYGTKNKRLKEFCMNHPFNKSTEPSIDSLTLPGTIPHTPGKKPQIDLDKWLHKYYSTLIQNKYDETPFLLNVYSHWGEKHFARLFVQAGTDKKDLSSDILEKLLLTYLQLKDAELRKTIRKTLKQNDIDIKAYRKRLIELK